MEKLTVDEICEEIASLWTDVRRLQKLIKRQQTRMTALEMAERERNEEDREKKGVAGARNTRCVWCSAEFMSTGDDCLRKHYLEDCKSHISQTQKQRISDLEKLNEALNRENQTYRDLLGGLSTTQEPRSEATHDTQVTK